MRDEDSGQTDDQLAKDAAFWVARMQSADASQEDHQNFQSWLDADAAHRMAYDEMRALWGDMRDVQLDIAAPPPRSLPGKAIITIAALLCLVGLGDTIFETGLIDRSRADYFTRVGQTRVVTLEDGTKVSLNTDAAIQQRYTDKERRIVLLRGEAFFDVARNPQKPFVVESESLKAKALGTHYAVRTADDGLDAEVQVEEGAVEVETPGSVTQLGAGDIATVTAHGTLVRSKADVANTTAWRDGKLVFSGQSLSEVLNVMSQYRHGRIVVLDDTAARLSVSGIFDLNDTDEALRILQNDLPVSVTYLSGLMVVVRSR